MAFSRLEIISKHRYADNVGFQKAFFSHALNRRLSISLDITYDPGPEQTAEWKYE
jgi:hypothetical protein